MKKINNIIIFYLLILLSFAYFYLYIKHQVGNDSTVSEWLINYEGGFTKRGIIGQLAIELTRLFDTNLRWVILLLQSSICTLYFVFLYKLFKDLKYDRTIILAIFTPIFILYPIAEIEVLARKEIIVFCLFLIYLFIPNNNYFKKISLVLFSSLSMLIWEPIIFFFPLILIYEIIENNIEKLNVSFFKIILSFVPSLIIALIIIFNPLTVEEHKSMAFVLDSEFGERCYMSCALLRAKSTIFQQFEGNFEHYNFVVFFRYTLIILVGFYPLFYLIKSSFLKNKKLLFFKLFNKQTNLLLICLLPALLLFAMGYDWGRWVNISYVILALIYFKLIINKRLIIDYIKLKKGILYRFNKKLFVLFFIVFCFGWNPKTVMKGDVGSFPGYRIPYKAFKILSN